MAHLMTITKIDGNDPLTIRTHILECDDCGERYEGGNGSDKGGPIMPVGYREHKPKLLLEHGKALGWTGLEKYTDWNNIRGIAPPDRCPICAAMKDAPYWPRVIHEPTARVLLQYQDQGPLVQKHTIVLPLEHIKVDIDTKGWPVRHRLTEPPSVMEVKITTNENPFVGVSFDNTVLWPYRKRGEGLKGRSPVIRLWSWDERRVYAKQITSI